MKFHGWWEIFKEAVHNQTSLSKVQKFTYLLSYLDGDALRMAEGYSLSDGNYDAVIDGLKERWGDPQRAQFGHFEALYEIHKARNDSLAEVQRVSEECERHIRSLIALELDEDSYCVCYIPLFLKKLPRYLTRRAKKLERRAAPILGCYFNDNDKKSDMYTKDQ